MGDATDPAEQPFEDRGVHYRVFWGGVTGMNGFSPWDGCVGFDVISVPIGWHLEPHERYGVVLCNLFGEFLTPQEARFWGAARVRGFRLMASVRLDAPVRCYRDVPVVPLAKNIQDRPE